jgi:large subunit ribosomal protein L18
MGSIKSKKQSRIKRKKRIRKRITGTPDIPRLSVFRSSIHIYAQLIDDVNGHTIVSASSVEKTIKDRSDFKSKVEKSLFIGKLIAERAIDKGIKKVVFDRNGFLYHGRVKAVSDGAREIGLIF